MNIKVRNTIIYAIFILIVFGLTFTSFYGEEIIFPREKNQPTSFDGLIFDEPTNITNLTVKRSVESDNQESLYKYDIHFNYAGANSDLRLLNTPVRQIFFPKGVVISRSNATLQGEYDKINAAIFPVLVTENWYSKLNDTNFLPKSEIRVPLNEEIGEYDFTVYTKPRSMNMRGGKSLAEIGAFITNAKMDKFTDDIKIEEPNISPTTKSKVESGTYINTLELVNESAMSRLNNTHRAGWILFVFGLILVLTSIWLNNPKMRILQIIGMFLGVMTVGPLLEKGVSNVAIFIIMPILAFIAVLLTRIFRSKNISLKSKDFQQALAYAIVFGIVNMLIYILPRGLF